MKKSKKGSYRYVLSAMLLGGYGMYASAATVTLYDASIITGAKSAQQTLNGSRTEAQDADTGTSLPGQIESRAQVGSDDYAKASGSVRLLSHGFEVSGGTYLHTAAGSFSNASATSRLDLYFSLDAATQVTIETGESLVGANTYRNQGDPNNSGIIKLFKDNAQLASVKSDSNYNEWVDFPVDTDNTLDLSAGTYHITGNFSSNGYQFSCPYSSCNADASMSLTFQQTDNVSAVPVPAAAWLMFSGMAALAGVGRRKKNS